MQSLAAFGSCKHKVGREIYKLITTQNDMIEKFAILRYLLRILQKRKGEKIKTITLSMDGEKVSVSMEGEKRRLNLRVCKDTSLAIEQVKFHDLFQRLQYFSSFASSYHA